MRKVSTPSGVSDVARLGPEHAEAVHRLECACFPQPWTLQQLERGLASPAFTAFGVLSGGQLLGYLSAYVVVDAAEVVNLAVRPQDRRRGFGRLLVVTVLQKWRDMGIKEGFLETRSSNVAARNLYSSCGFVQVGVRAHYYPDTGEDAVLLQCRL